MSTTASSAPIAVLDRIRPGRPAAKAADSPAVRVLSADSQGLVRAGFRLLLDATERISVVGEAASGEEPVAVAHRLRPDVAQAARMLGCLRKRLHPRGSTGTENV